MFQVLHVCYFTKVSPPTSVTAVVLILYPRTLRLGRRNYVESHGPEVERQASSQSLAQSAALPSLSAGPAALARGGAAEASGPGPGRGVRGCSELPRALPRPLGQGSSEASPSYRKPSRSPQGSSS